MWQSLSVAKKICTCVAIIVLGYAIAMIFVIVQGTGSQKHLSEMESGLFPAAQLSQAALTAFEQEVKAYGDAVIMGDAKGLELARVRGVEVHDALASMIQKKGITPKVTAIIQECLSQLKGYSEEARPVYESMVGGSMDQMEKAVMLGKRAAALKDKIEGLTRELSDNVRTELTSNAMASRNQVMVSVAALVWVFISSGFLIYLTTIVIRPLAGMTEIAHRIADGDVNQMVRYQSRDEIGMLAEAFRAMIAYIKGIAEAADLLSRGEVDVHITARSEKDLLGKNFVKVAETLCLMTAETAQLTRAAQAGKLDIRGDTSKLPGAFAAIIKGFNNTLDMVIAPINEAAAVLQQMSQKNLVRRMKGNYQGDFARIKEGLNLVLENLESSLQQVANGSEQITLAAENIASGSQSLSQGASEQAAAIEEFSSNLQETAAMARQNASNAQHTRGVAEQAKQDATLGTENMQRLSEAISRIKKSADQSAKIVKTINEIAFQTNLLALNAAVEAARSGDAGRGFAVVAEEVRNLAMRSAEAARNTSTLIEESVKNSDQGVALNKEVFGNLTVIRQQINTVSEVIAEIATASDQQRAGLDQVNKAVAQMNTITQQTAANAEESASAAQQLSGRAAEMQAMVRTFNLTSRTSSALPARQAEDFGDRIPLTAQEENLLANY
jgi:methyl-accepting chemotaxis protein